MKKVKDVGEEGLLEEIFPLLGGDDFLGGDDCAVVDGGGEGRLQLLKTDAVVEGVHFLRGEKAERVGWKAIARVVSDFAAMGGRGQDYLVTIALDEDVEVEWVKGLYVGMQKCLAAYGGRIVGGETVSVPRGTAAMISIAGTGVVEKNSVKRRSGGEIGDLVFVTGRLGGSIQGKHLDFFPRVEEGVWLGQCGEVGAMMDLSDGLAKDLPRLAKASGCGLVLDEEAVPCHDGCDLKQALQDGEDYELLFTVRNGGAANFLANWKAEFEALNVSQIGELVELGQGGQLEGGWEHFS